MKPKPKDKRDKQWWRDWRKKKREERERREAAAAAAAAGDGEEVTIGPGGEVIRKAAGAGSAPGGHDGGGPAPGSGGPLIPPGAQQAPRTDAPSSDTGAPNNPAQQAQDAGLVGLEGLEDALLSFLNGVPELILSNIEHGDEWEWKKVSRKESKMLASSTIKYVKTQHPDIAATGDSGEVLALKYALVMGGKLRKKRKVISNGQGGGPKG